MLYFKQSYHFLFFVILLIFPIHGMQAPLTRVTGLNPASSVNRELDQIRVNQEIDQIRVTFKNYIPQNDRIIGDVPQIISMLIMMLNRPANNANPPVIANPPAVNANAPAVNADENRAKGVILYGPTGSGKSTLAERIAAQTGRPMATIYSYKFHTKWKASAPEAMTRVFELVTERARQGPVILFIDEVDGVIDTQTNNNEGGNLAAVYALHDLMHTLHPNIFIILALNDFDLVPETVKSRFAPYHVPILQPTLLELRAMLMQLCQREAYAIPAERFFALASATEGISRRDICNSIMLGSELARLPSRVIAQANQNQPAAQGLAAQPRRPDESDFLRALCILRKTPLLNLQVSLLRFYIENKMPYQGEDAFLDSLAQKLADWDAQKIERLVNNAAALAAGRAHMEPRDLLVALGFTAPDMRPVLADGVDFIQYLLSELQLAQRIQVQNLARDLSGLSFDEIQRLMRVAQNIAATMNQPVSHDHFLAAQCVVTDNILSGDDKHRALLRYLLFGKIVNGLSEADLTELTTLTRNHCKPLDIELCVGLAKHISDSQTFDVRNFVTAFYCHSNAPMVVPLHAQWCLEYMTKVPRGTINFQEFLNFMGRVWTYGELAQLILSAGNLATALSRGHTENNIVVNLPGPDIVTGDHLIISACIMIPAILNQFRIRERLFSILMRLGGWNVIDENLVSGTMASRTESLDMRAINAIVNVAKFIKLEQQPNTRQLNTEDLWIGLTYYLKTLEVNVELTYRADEINYDALNRMRRNRQDIIDVNASNRQVVHRDRLPKLPNNTYYWPRAEEIAALINHNCRLNGSHQIPAEFIQEFARNCVNRISHHGLREICACAREYATRRSPNNSVRTEGDLKAAAFDLYGFFLPTNSREWLYWWGVRCETIGIRYLENIGIPVT